MGRERDCKREYKAKRYVTLLNTQIRLAVSSQDLQSHRSCQRSLIGKEKRSLKTSQQVSHKDTKREERGVRESMKYRQMRAHPFCTLGLNGPVPSAHRREFIIQGEVLE
ncbi:10302_t:CDS:2, partial [Acaulospora colombiana]